MTPSSSRPHATTCGSTSPGWAATRRRRCRSSSAATAATSRTSHGKRYLDALAGLFSVQIGYGYGEEMGEAAAAQMRELPFYTNWTYAHPRAIELAAEVASLAPGDLNRVFFMSGGSEAVESAWKLARQYHARAASGAGRRSRRTSPTTARPWARCRSTGIPAIATRSSRSCPMSSTSATRTATTGRRARARREFTAFLLDDLERGDRGGGPGDGRDGDHGAGAERGRLLHTAGRLLPRACASSATATGSCSSPTR